MLLSLSVSLTTFQRPGRRRAGPQKKRLQIMGKLLPALRTYYYRQPAAF